ncbi:MAG TPA: bifunctional [glutamate--ammonia ligase]-adenylyl-L-tyrosine phosphorylase/[glutamate--ammonia-ligase] adenylyltransferase [Polyangia bacterium]|jgi:glutamate-ammonia-ligase adenylyltransferase
MGDPVAEVLAALAAEDAPSEELLGRLDQPLRGLAAALKHGPDPHGGLLRLRQLLAGAVGLEPWLRAVLGEPRAVALLATLVAQSPYLAQMIARQPHLVQELVADPYLTREKDQATMRAELARTLGDATGPGDVMRVLRLYHHHEILRLGARELGWGTFAEVGRELSALAGACLDAAVGAARAELERRYGPAREAGGARARFAVIGMGKLGGRELNFSSDVDLICVYSSDEGGAGALALHELFVKLAERVTRLIAEPTEDGFVFRVDHRLRPEGTSGPLANSVASLESYYETWGRPWERQAWLKARPVAGDLDLGDEVLRVLEPFVYPRTIGPRVIEEINDLNRRIKAELRGEGERNVKLGPGGIREIEFFTQALQLLHAGKNPALRARGTLKALDTLLFAGLVSAEEHRRLVDAYVFLRRLEHRLQLESGQQTHSLPEGEAALARLGRRLGCPTLGVFRGALARHRGAVSAIYATLGAPAELPPDIAALLDPAADLAALRARLDALGFHDPEASAQELDLLRRKPQSPFGAAAAGPAARLAPVLLEEIRRSPDPDLALRHLSQLVSRRGSSAGLWGLLEAERPLVRLLVSLFGTSDFLSKLFLAHPDRIEQLLAMGRAAPHKSQDDLAAELGARLAEPALGYEDALNVLRRFRNEELVRIGLYDSAGALDAIAVQEQLSDLADVILAAVLPLVVAQVAARYGAPRFGPPGGPPRDEPARLAVIGLGKLGGREITYASDLDLIFVYAGDGGDVTAGGITRQELHSRVATRLLSALGTAMDEGRLYEVDTRLRPSGQHGALVSSQEAFEEYHRTQAWLWERQALVRARFVAGDAELGRQLEARCAEYAYRPGAPADPDMAAVIARMRARMEKELAREEPGRYNIKSGRGGLVDIEFVVQYLQLRYGGADRTLRLRGTLPALGALRAAGVLPEAAAQALTEGYLFLRRLENRLRIVQDRSISELRSDPVEIEKLARRMGYHDPSAASGARLLGDYLTHTGRVRELYRTFFPVAHG